MNVPSQCPMDLYLVIFGILKQKPLTETDPYF